MKVRAHGAEIGQSLGIRPIVFARNIGFVPAFPGRDVPSIGRDMVVEGSYEILPIRIAGRYVNGWITSARGLAIAGI